MGCAVRDNHRPCQVCARWVLESPYQCRRQRGSYKKGMMMYFSADSPIGRVLLSKRRDARFESRSACYRTRAQPSGMAQVETVPSSPNWCTPRLLPDSQDVSPGEYRTSTQPSPYSPIGRGGVFKPHLVEVRVLIGTQRLFFKHYHQ